VGYLLNTYTVPEEEHSGQVYVQEAGDVASPTWTTCHKNRYPHKTLSYCLDQNKRKWVLACQKQHPIYYSYQGNLFPILCSKILCLKQPCYFVHDILEAQNSEKVQVGTSWLGFSCGCREMSVGLWPSEDLMGLSVQNCSLTRMAVAAVKGSSAGLSLNDYMWFSQSRWDAVPGSSGIQAPESQQKREVTSPFRLSLRSHIVSFLCILIITRTLTFMERRYRLYLWTREVSSNLQS
jgi:hypothetical protein